MFELTESADLLSWLPNSYNSYLGSIKQIDALLITVLKILENVRSR